MAAAITDRRSLEAQPVEARSALAPAEAAYRITRVRYEGGLSSYIDALSVEDQTAGVAVVLFGAAEGEATLEQAEQFALLWADHIADDIVGVRFCYIDGTENWQARGMFGVDELPTTLAIRNGAGAHRFEGLHTCEEISQALHRPRPARVQPHSQWRRHDVDAGSQRGAA